MVALLDGGSPAGPNEKRLGASMDGQPDFIKK